MSKRLKRDRRVYPLVYGLTMDLKEGRTDRSDSYRSATPPALSAVSIDVD
ncbi:MAG: hypothetical protein WAL83_07235 [Arenicellales bacterium]